MESSEYHSSPVGLFTLIEACVKVRGRSGCQFNGNTQLTDAEWVRIASAMPTPRGDCKLPTRQVLEDWLFVTKESCSSRALPERFGPWRTVYMRGRGGIDQGVLERVFAKLQRVELEAIGRSRCLSPA